MVTLLQFMIRADRSRVRMALLVRRTRNTTSTRAHVPKITMAVTAKVCHIIDLITTFMIRLRMRVILLNARPHCCPIQWKHGFRHSVQYDDIYLSVCINETRQRCKVNQRTCQKRDPCMPPPALISFHFISF